MRKLRPRLRAYVLAVYAAALASLAIAALPAPSGGSDLAVFGVLFVLAAAAKTWSIHVGPKTKVTVEETATFAAVLLLAPFLAGLLAGAASLAGLAVARRPAMMRSSLRNRLFNAASATVATTLAALTFRALAPDGALFREPLAVPAAAVVNYLVRTELADAAVALQLRRSLFTMWWADHRRDIGQQAALFALGTLAATSAREHPWALGLFAFPMFVVLLTLRETTKMRSDTKAAIIELADLIDQRDRYTYGHSIRVAEYARRLALWMGLSPTQVDLVTEAARVHDIGKITTPDAVLQKPGPLDDEELVEMRRHCRSGHEILRTLPEFWEGADLVLLHHERVDGTGYPRGLRGDELPLEVSIIAMCDAYDAMNSDRVYRRALPRSRILDELRRGRGSQWTELAVDGLQAMLAEERAAKADAVPLRVRASS